MTKDTAVWRRLFTDRSVLESIDGAELRLHHPERREVCYEPEGPSTTNIFGMSTIVRRPEGGWRLYYRGGVFWKTRGRKRSGTGGMFAADSSDGLTWKPVTRKSLLDADTFMPTASAHPLAATVFGDDNPACPPDEYYKMIFAAEYQNRDRLFMFLAVSGDGIRFRLKSPEPFDISSDFDTQNILFWDKMIGQYRLYTRIRRFGIRGIRMHLTCDFKKFTNSTDLVYYDDRFPRTQLYTNCIMPYFRAPGLYVGFPGRYVDNGQVWDENVLSRPELARRRALALAAGEVRLATASTDSLFMSSSDGWSFHRRDESFVRPGPCTRGNWIYGDDFFAYGMILTPSHLGDGAPDEISMYLHENYRSSTPGRLRRLTLRQDGFVSVHFPAAGGEIVTRPFVFTGSALSVNISTGAWGRCRATVLDESGAPVPEYSGSFDLCGDALGMVLRWKNVSADMRSLRGRTLKLRITGRDADLYSFAQEKSVPRLELPPLAVTRKEPAI